MIMKRISFNSPVVLTFTIVSALVLLLNYLTGGISNALLFSVYKGSLLDPLFYVRLFGHVLGHANLEHYASNMILFLLVGPLLEEKYGSKKLVFIIMLVALVTGIIHILLPGNSMLLGASGVDFALIILASITGAKDNKIPLTLIIVAFIYISQQIYQGIFLNDQVSQLTHIVGGCVGGIYGLTNRN